MRRPCLEIGCSGWAVAAGSRCRGCQRKRRRATYDHPDYRALPRPTGSCQLRISKNCSGRAESWDHKDGNPFNHARSNLAGACLSCNSSKQDRAIDY